MRLITYGLCLLSLLAGCGGDLNQLPPSRPTGAVSGYVIDGPIANAQVTIYDFSTGRKGRALGSATTANDGAFTIGLHERDLPIYIEAQGGSYVEEASAKTVYLQQGERLTAVAHYQGGKAMNVVITPYSHMATGLAEYNIGQGADVNVAITSATQTISALIGLNVASVVPQSISVLSNALVKPTFNDNYAYGFMLAAISSWTAWASQQSGTNVHESVTSILLAQLMYRDIYTDGLLDGRAYDEGATANIELRAGGMALGPEVYQKGFGQQMLNVANSEMNKTGFGVADVRSRANYLIQTSLNAPGLAPVEDKIGPAINRSPAAKLYENGTLNFSVSVDDPAGISLVAFEIDNTPIGNAADLLTPAITIDTRQYADGVHTINVIAEDSAGNRSSARFEVLFANASPFILITSPAMTNKELFTLKGIFVANDFDFAELKAQDRLINVEPNGAWQIDLTLASGVNNILVSAIDKQGKQSDLIHKVVLDAVAPLIFVSYSAARFISDDGIFSGTLAAASEGGPRLFIQNPDASMEGITVTTEELNARGIPFLEVAILDMPRPELLTPPAQVRVQYALNEVILSEKELQPSAGAAFGGNYLVYLALDMIHQDWKTAKRRDVHHLTVIAKDQASNESRFELKFRTRFGSEDDRDDDDDD